MDKKKFFVKGKTVTMYLSGKENASLIVMFHKPCHFISELLDKCCNIAMPQMELKFR